ncbi:MAG: glycosyltransferase family 4 protein [Actinomycetota bacterium]
MKPAGGVTVAVTMEQLWHRVPGGTATATLGMVNALATRDDVELIGVAARHARPPEPSFRTRIAIKQLPLPRSALYETWHLLRGPRVQRATGPVDVVHATTLAVPPPSAPLVVTIHDLAFMDRPQDFTRRGMRLFTRGLELARRDAALVLCPSQTTKNDCIAHGFDPERVDVVPWGVAAIAPPPQTQIRARFGLERAFVLWTGTIEPRKNLPVLLDAFSTLDHDVDLVLAGPQGWKQDLGARISSDPRVRSVGFVDPATLAGLYAAADAFCYPSLKEGFGLPVLEAMAQGAPVITSQGTSTEEVGGDAVLLVDPRDVNAVAAALESVLDDHDLARSLSNAGRRRAATFTWDRTAGLVAAAYRRVVGAGP